MANHAAPAAEADRESREPGTEQRIFDAALEVFARKGQDGTRMREIADHAQINRALLHYYFRNKSQLYEAVFAHAFGQFIRGFAQKLKAEQSFEDALRAFVNGYIDYVQKHQDMARLMLNDCLCGGPVLNQYLTTAMEEPDGFPGLVMEDRIVRAIGDGDVRDVDPKQTMITIVSACLFFFVALPTVRIFHPEVEDDFDAFVEQRKEHVVDLVLRGLLVRDGER